MNIKEIEQLEKKSLYTIRLNNEIKESVISSKFNELSMFVKREIKKNELVIIIVKIH